MPLIAGRVARLALILACTVAPAAVAQVPALERLTVISDGFPITVWARRPAAARGTILLVHGRTWSALPDFDLQVPGESRSIMASLAERGYAAYAIDQRGYGSTPRDHTGWLTPKRAVADVNSVLLWITAHTAAQSKPVLLGWSVGSMVAQLTAQLHGPSLSALILYGAPFDPDDRIAQTTYPATAPHDSNSAEGATSDFISPGVTSQKTIEAYAAAAFRADPILAQWRGLDEWNALNPSRVHVPTLLLQGEKDPSLPHDALMRLYNRLATTDKQWITLMGGDHAALLETTRPSFVDAVVGWMERH